MTHALLTAYSSAPTVTVTDTGGGTGAVLTSSINLPCMPYGARIALDPTYLAQHTGAGCPAGSNCLTGPALVVATALATYGGLLLDNTCCGLFTFDASNDIALDPAVENSIKGALSHLHLTDFDIYDQSGLAKNATTDNNTDCQNDYGAVKCVSNQVLPSNSLNYIPPGAAWVTATNSSGQSIAVDMPLWPATIGTPDPEIYILAGDYSGSKGTGGGYQIPFWVKGVSNQAVTWALQASPNGSITSGGIYTPPATVTTTGLQDVATCTLNQDSNITMQVYINILPNSGNYQANTIRVDSGTGSNFGPDGQGDFWLGNIGLYSGDRSNLNGGAWKYFKGVGPSVGEGTVYSTGFFPQNDVLYKFIVPNGNYNVRLMSGWDLQGSGSAAQISIAAWNHMPMMVFSSDNGYDGTLGGTGGVKVAHWNMMADAAFPYATNSNSDIVFGTKVVNNVMELGLGNDAAYPAGFPTCTNSCLGSPEVSGVDIEPDTTAPHLSIGVTNGLPNSNPAPFMNANPTVSLGKVIALYVQDWYTGLTDPSTGIIPVDWSLLSGPGTLTTSTVAMTAGQTFPIATYTPPATQPAANTGVVIRATSQSNPAIYATIALQIKGTATTPVFFK